MVRMSIEYDAKYVNDPSFIYGWSYKM